MSDKAIPRISRGNFLTVSLPNSVGWIALLIAVFKVLSGINGHISHESNAGRYANFVPFLSALAERFHAAKVLLDMMGEATGEIVEKSITLGVARKDVHYRLPEKPKSSKVAGCPKDAEEAELMDCVAKMVDLRLSANGSK
jgi:hypothetical protein